MHEGRADSADQVEDKILKMPQGFLDRPAKDPKKQHVAEQVQPSPVQEHAREHGKDRLRNRDAMSGEKQLLMGRNESEAVHEGASHTRSQRDLMKERQHVHEDQ